MTASISRMGAAVAGMISMLASTAHAGGLTLAHPYSEGSSVDVWARDFAECAERVTGIYVEVFGSGKLGRAGDIADAVEQGVIDMAILPARAMEQRWPVLGGLSQSGQVYDPADMLRLSDSQRFIEDLSRIGVQEHNMAVLALGWQYSALVGGESELNDLGGKNLLVQDQTMQQAVKYMGANSVVLNPGELDAALKFDAIDGAIVDIDTARLGFDKGTFAQIQLSSDFTPLASPIAVVMNANSFAFTEDFPSLISSECLLVTHKFNQAAIDEMTSLADAAKGAGAEVLELGHSERAVWRDAFKQIYDEKMDIHNPVAAAIEQELLR